MDFFENWDDDWGEAAVAEPEPEPEPVQHKYAPQSEPQPIYEEPTVETAPAPQPPPVETQPVPASQDAWYEDDGWGNFSTEPVKKEPQPVEPPTHVAEPVAPEPSKPEPAPKAQPRATPIAPRAAPVAQSRVQTRQPQPEKTTSSWGKNADTSLFANPTRQTKQAKTKKQAPKQPKRSADTRKPPITNKQKKTAETVEDREEVAADSSALRLENKSLTQEVEELRSQLGDMHQRLLHLEHSKRLLYNSVCTLNSSGDCIDGRICWNDEYGGDILPAQKIAYQLTPNGTGLTIVHDGLYEITFNSFGQDPYIQINNETYATGHTNNTSSYLSICVYVADKPVITCHVTNPVTGNACDHWLCIRRFPS